MYTIYKLTNDINGLIYVGCTTQTLKRRLQGHKDLYKKKQSAIYKAMQEFGFDSFSVSILEQGDNEDIRYEREKYWIATLNSMNPSIGYNMSIGGLGVIGYKFTKEDKIKMSNSHKGKKLSEETKKNLSLAMKGRFTGDSNSFYGRHHTEETKAKTKATKIRLNICKAVIGINLKTGEIVKFGSIADAGRFILKSRKTTLHTIRNCINEALKGRNKTAYGYKWRYVDKLNDYPDKE